MNTFSVLILTAPPPGFPTPAKSADAPIAGPYVKIDGREAIVRSAELFLNRDNVKQIQVAFLPEDVEEGKRKYGGHFGFSGIKVVSGGPRWMDQCIAGAAKIIDEATHVIIHDSARPAVPYSDIDALMEAAEKKPIAALSSPCRDGLIALDEGGNPIAFHSSKEFVNLLTPQVFKKDKFLTMTQSKLETHASQFHLVPGSYLNMRINSSQDAQLVKAMINMLPKPKIKPLNSPFDEAQW